eukprot:gnl/TRDRNA2_/TRDRNA2_192676_c0_seq1.p1 gnl/TRDRNA2_/TRDRNA2_192676_c0~~gnl/TRDRNA2_/TRDRNA2_192676_c0_seq1.p1  ORF type:complete len:167 (+),score=24.24 gnl/TRDRNA2_/TRDRNA2_192676_c0_seq1:72-572(+)
MPRGSVGAALYGPDIDHPHLQEGDWFVSHPRSLVSATDANGFCILGPLPSTRRATSFLSTAPAVERLEVRRPSTAATSFNEAPAHAHEAGASKAEVALEHAKDGMKTCVLAAVASLAAFSSSYVSYSMDYERNEEEELKAEERRRDREGHNSHASAHGPDGAAGGQ